MLGQEDSRAEAAQFLGIQREVPLGRGEDFIIRETAFLWR
jgi:hypothetical protein